MSGRSCSREEGLADARLSAEGMFLAQYEVLRENGHSPSEAFNETVEEATQSLFPLIGKYGMDYMYNACSTTARRGALDWAPKFHEANKPVFEALYKSVRDGTETRRSLEFNGRPDYREAFAKETAEIDNQEICEPCSQSVFLAYCLLTLSPRPLSQGAPARLSVPSAPITRATTRAHHLCNPPLYFLCEISVGFSFAWRSGLFTETLLPPRSSGLLFWEISTFSLWSTGW